MTDSLNSDFQRDLWRECRKINSVGKPSPSNVDGGTGDADIASVFARKYKELYNSVSFSEFVMSELQSRIQHDIINICCCGKCDSRHEISVDDVRAALGHLKAGKDEGLLSTDHVIHGCPELFIHLSILYTSMIRHGFPHRLSYYQQ